ncbi:MAG TPA: hypothetical protein VEZ47_00525 [Gemmatirosa sp.]|nr:hypothetical protein [Gemmatirosa sp.]
MTPLPASSMVRRALPAAGLGVTLGVVPAGRAEAQRAELPFAGPPPTGVLRAGDTVRVAPDSAPTLRIRGVLLCADSAGLTLARRGYGVPLTLAWAEVRRVERLADRQPAGDAFVRGARWGALVGGVASVAAVGLAVRAERQQRSERYFCCVGVGVAGAAGLVFTGMSTAAGGVIAQAFRERWAPLRPP